MTDSEIMMMSRRLLAPYVIPSECPYLSEDQQELSRQTLEGRSAWMAEWLLLAGSAPHGVALKRTLVTGKLSPLRS
jgi:hypothetical protein